MLYVIALSGLLFIIRCLKYTHRNLLFCFRENVYHPGHLLLDSVPNLGPLISCWEINKFENCWYKSVRILEVLSLLFQQSLNLSSSQRDMSRPILGALSKNRWSWGMLSFWIASYYNECCTLWILLTFICRSWYHRAFQKLFGIYKTA
jgi:hypothetical protein